jgi:hypothetical protein
MATPPASGNEFDVSEAIAASDEGTLSAGDVADIPGSVSGALRNDGQEPAVGLVVVVAPGGILSGTSGAAATPVAYATAPNRTESAAPSRRPEPPIECFSASC